MRKRWADHQKKILNELVIDDICPICDAVRRYRIVTKIRGIEYYSRDIASTMTPFEMYEKYMYTGGFRCIEEFVDGEWRIV